MKRLGVLISGRGTNLQSIIDAIAAGRLRAEIAIVISNRPDAPGLVRAERAGIATEIIEHRDPRFGSRQAYDEELVRVLRAHRVDLVCLAGFMRLLSPVFLEAFPNAILNIHPSLLPAFPGTNAQYQAWEHGVKVSGATVHFVTTELDGGPIIVQEPVTVRDDDTPESLAARILEAEHRLYPAAIGMVLDGSVTLQGRRVVAAAVASADPKRVG